MKKILLSSFLIFSALLVMQTICQAQTVQTVPLYRLFYEDFQAGNTNGGSQSEHFYTANKAERDSLLKNFDRSTAGGGGFFSYDSFGNQHFLDEGIEGYLSPKQVPGTVPLYRLYKDPMKHYYTANATEKDKAISQSGYRFLDIVGYVSAVQKPGTTPLYRVYRATKGITRDDHLYTIKEDEKFGALHKYGYVDDGITCYVWTSAVTLSTAPLIRKP
jgi:hypothetical protein